MLDVVSFMFKNTVERRSRWAGHVEHKGDKTIACTIKVKVNFAPEQATKARRGCTGVTLLFI
jgi:hypothetical protein